MVLLPELTLVPIKTPEGSRSPTGKWPIESPERKTIDREMLLINFIDFFYAIAQQFPTALRTTCKEDTPRGVPPTVQYCSAKNLQASKLAATLARVPLGSIQELSF